MRAGPLRSLLAGSYQRRALVSGRGRTISSDNPVTEAPNELLGRVTAVYRLVVHPVVLGAGTPFFPPGVSRFDLRLIESRAFASGAMYLGYEAVR
jgi:hypothetical protein